MAVGFSRKHCRPPPPLPPPPLPPPPPPPPLPSSSSSSSLFYRSLTLKRRDRLIVRGSGVVIYRWLHPSASEHSVPGHRYRSPRGTEPLCTHTAALGRLLVQFA
jgi:hypothetical protein